VGDRHRFTKASRLLDASDYRRVFDGVEAKASHRHVLLLARCNHGPGHRLGLVIAKKHVRLSVQRNRIKRIAREVFRQLPPSQPSLDIILLARPGMDQLDNARLSTILRQQCERLFRHAPGPDEGTHR